MASEYLKQKYKDVKPDPPKELTPEEKRKNWWYYHKWHVVGGIVLALLAANLIWDVTGRGKPKPDYQVGYVGSLSLPDDTVSAMGAALAAYGEDLNGDGQVLVRIRQYVSNADGDPSAVSAIAVQLIADVSEQESFLFLLEDPESFQRYYRALSYRDGSLPPEEDNSVDNMALRWEDCPVLAGLDLGDYTHEMFGIGTITGSSQELLSDLYIARRGFWEGTEPEYAENYTALWEALTEGAD